MKFLIVHPGSSVSTHDVFMGLHEGIRALGHQITIYPLDRKIAAAGKFLNDQRAIEIEQMKMDLPPCASHTEILLQASEGLVVRALWGAVDWVVIVSGMYVPLHTLQTLKLAKIKIALVLTESPYDEEFEAKWSKYADVTFTNERTTADKIGAIYLPHAWRRGLHDRSKESLTDVLPSPTSRHDCVFVGTGFGERVEWLKRYADSGGPLSLYGTWPQPEMKPYLADPEREDGEWIVTNEQATALYAHARCSLNLYRTSKGDTGFSDAPQHIAHAESMNPRAYELAAAGCLYVSTPRAEIGEKFGDLVPQVSTPEEGADAVKRMLAMPNEVQRAMRARLQQAVYYDTWHDRAKAVTDALA